VIASLSQRIGRRRAIIASALLSILVIPLWAFSDDPVYLGLGAFLMMFLVQGCGGVIARELGADRLERVHFRASRPQWSRGTQGSHAIDCK
jgi:MFS family permease